MQIKHLTRSLIDRILAERKAGGLFRSFADFLNRIEPEPTQTQSLIRAGCCDSLAGELTRPALIWRLYAWYGRNKRHTSLVNGQSPLAPLSPPLPIPAEYSESQRVQHEIESVGFPLNRHPLDLYRDTLQGLKYVPACRMSEYVKQRITMIGWLITEKSAYTKDGEPMEFVSFEDTTGLYDATLFPAIYRRVCHLLAVGVPYIVGGIVEEEFGAVTLTVIELRILNAPAKQSCSGPGLTFGS